MKQQETEGHLIEDRAEGSLSPDVSVLIVDDDWGTARTTALILDRKGYAVETAASGAEALAKVRERPFDVILLDIRMPVMDGIETHRRIKAIRPHAVVVMMTAYALDELIQQALDDGAYGILYKPLDVDRLLAIVREARASRAGALVLVVDDNPAIRSALEQALVAEGCGVALARSGDEALALARERAHDVLFIDLKLPTLNGLETYLAIKEINPAAIAVIMTAYPDQMGELAREAIERDAYAFLKKPFDVDDVLALVQEISAVRTSGSAGSADR
ncbi:MAG: response regulator [Chloroflexota bacterium]